MSLDPFFQLDPESCCWPSDDHHAARSWSAGRGFSGSRIDPECLRIGSDGSVRVSLSAPAEPWFNMLAQLGETLQLSRNAVAVLGQLGPMPAVEDWGHPMLPRDKSGLFAPNLAEYARLRALRECSPMGLMHGFEVAGPAGNAFHQIILTQSSNRELFEKFVIEHQSPTHEAGAWFPPNHAWSAQRSARIDGRIPWLRCQLALGSPDVRLLPVESVSRILTAAQEFGISIRTTSYGRGLIQGAIWQPEGHETTTDSAGKVLEFFHGHRIGLHLNYEAVGSVWFWSGRCSCCDEHKWTLELADAQGRVCLAVMAGSEEGEPAWRYLLKRCLHE